MKSTDNLINLVGTVRSKFEFSHQMYGEEFYIVHVGTMRTSGHEDVIPVLVSNRLTDIGQDLIGTRVEVEGSIRTYNKHDNSPRKLLIYAFASRFYETSRLDDDNTVYLNGYLCKTPVYRETPLGRQIVDIILAVNRTTYGKSDYIPCISWGRNAVYVSNKLIGQALTLQGRMQSRTYKKAIENGLEERTAYEVSAQWVYEPVTESSNDNI